MRRHENRDAAMVDLAALIKRGVPLLADGATGTSYFEMGLAAGDPPELWNVESPKRVRALHSAFVDAGADLILTNTFGANRDRLKLHQAEKRARELNRRGAEIARDAADRAGRPVVVAGSMGPLGELFEPLGALSHESACEAFSEQADGLKEGGADVCWIETMSSIEEIRAAAAAAIAIGMPYTVTASFDTAGRTMMGLAPEDLGGEIADLDQQPIAYGANCGVGAADLLVALRAMREASPAAALIGKANCGVPVVKGDHVHYSGTPALMARYAALAVDLGITIIGGCCGTTADHIAAMRNALDGHRPGPPPDQPAIEAALGALVAPASAKAGRSRRTRRAGRRRAG